MDKRENLQLLNYHFFTVPDVNAGAQACAFLLALAGKCEGALQCGGLAGLNGLYACVFVAAHVLEVAGKS